VHEIPKLEAARGIVAERFIRDGDPRDEALAEVFHAAMREFQLIPDQHRTPLSDAAVHLAETILEEELG
jgi:hypothetical protein